MPPRRVEADAGIKLHYHFGTVDDLFVAVFRRRAERIAAFIAEASHILEQLRQRTAAPILIDGLPEPTVQPLGLAERGLRGNLEPDLAAAWRYQRKVVETVRASYVDYLARLKITCLRGTATMRG